jgi:hypothetical protein
MAHLDPAASPTITVMGEEDPIEINFGAVAAYHGQGALAMLAITFRALELALKTLSPDRPAKRSDITILSGHPGPGVRDCFEFVTRAVTRGVYTVDRSLPKARLAPPPADLSYSFRVTIGGRAAEIAVLPGALPARFFALTFNPNRTAEEDAEARALRKAIAVDVLAASAEKLFELDIVG